MFTICEIIPVSIALHHCFIHIGVRELLLRTFYGWENAIIDLLEENLHLQLQKQSDLSNTDTEGGIFNRIFLCLYSYLSKKIAITCLFSIN